MRILVCDSDASSRTVVRRLVMLAHGYDVVECVSGAEALELLSADAFDLLLLETDLPVLTGFETLAIIREAPELSQMPVILVTSDRTEESVQRAIELGVTDYILKPLRVQRLKASLRSVLATNGEGRQGSSISKVMIDARARVMLVDADADFRELFGGLMSPYCAFVSVASGATALSEAWQHVPSVVFIGRGLGLVSPTALVRHLAKLGVGRIVKLAAPEESAADAASSLYHDVIGRTLVPAAMLRQLKRFISHGGGPLHKLLEHVPDLRTILMKATASTFGMMLGQEVDVVEPGQSDVVDAHAVVTMQVGESTHLKVEIQCAAELVRQLAANTLGDDVDAATAVSVLGEIANVVTGRLQATVIERGVRCLCSLPAFAVGQAPRTPEDDDAERLVLELAPSDQGARFRIVMTVREIVVVQPDATDLDAARTA
ncbi:MAG: response regulator [Vicinamibacterales bacterium]